MTDLETLLDRYVELIVRVGLNLRAGQKLMISAPIATAPLVRKLVASAYKAGARLVDVNWNDEELTRIRFENAPGDSFTEYPTWRERGREEHIRAGHAVLSIYASNPDLLKGQDPERIATYMKTASQNTQTVLDLISKDEVNWCVVSMPVTAWATRVFPGLSEEQAMQKLWDAILHVSRVDLPDPVGAWKLHMDGLMARAAYLNRKKYAAVRFRGPGTDLTLGLPDGHAWMGAKSIAATGVEFTPTLPPEEIFPLPHKDRADGVVTCTRPLHYAGTLIENFRLTFQAGKVVDFPAEAGEEQLRSLLETDEGAQRLGEVALVPNSSPVAQTGLLFYNMLFDENAASHLALGNAYPTCLEGGASLNEEELAARGANTSSTHEDFMVGSEQVDVDGVTASGASEALMRAGEWAFDI